jgi:hypothetical protein
VFIALTAVVRGVARFADVGLQYLGVAEDDQTGKMMMVDDILATRGRSVIGHR